MKKYLQLLLALGLAFAAQAQDPAYPPAPAAQVNITSAEYFVDNDPGPGSATAISVSAAIDINNIGALINVNGLSNGVHRLFLRTRNASGYWSITNEKDFLYSSDPPYVTASPAPKNITRAEYFIDTDPGPGAGVAIPLTAGLDLAGITVSVNTANLSNGTHRLYIRSGNNEGRWSLTAEKDFIINFDLPYPPAPAAAKNIIAAEYFFDTDPGAGGGSAIAVTASVDLANLSATVSTAGLSVGTHRLYFRTKNLDGSWSLTAEKDMIVNLDYSYPSAPAAAKNIIVAEYFFDSDPGAGNGSAIAVGGSVDLANLSATVSTAGLSVGTHRLYFRTKNLDGSWSLTAEKDMIVNLDYSYPPAPAATQNIVRAEYFIDTDPGAGNATAIALTPGVDLASTSITVATGSLSDGKHTLYLRTKNQEGRWSHTAIDSFHVGVELPSWALSPAGGHDYGSVQTGQSSSFTFTINNTGSIPVVLSNVLSTDPAFTTSFTPGASIPAGGSIHLPVTFTPTAVASYSSRIRIVSNAGGPDTVTVVVTGKGFLAGIPPALNYVAAAPYGGIRGVNADAGQPGLYTYKIVYKSADGRPPQAQYPQLGIDRNGDGDFTDAGEGRYTMTKQDTSTDYAAGVVFTYSVNLSDYSSTLGYQFFAVDDQGNAAASGNTAYKSGPIITYQLLDLKIFASDISFSKANPLPGEAFTLTANISNSSAYSVTNVPVKFYKDTILLDSAVIPSVGAYSSGTVTKVFSFPTDGFYPIKVWIDSARTLTESNYLNNYAIRPVNVGKVVLPGGINITTTASLQSCPQALLISGTAAYYGASSPTAVAGGEVTITIGTRTFTTTTDANGNYSYLLSNPACGAALAYTVSVTDFTFTSLPKANSINIPCPAANACAVTPQPGVSVASAFSSAPCSLMKGATGSVNVTVTYRARDINNMWSLWDNIQKDTVKIFQNGVLIQTYWSADGSTSPGDSKTIPVNISLDTTGPNIITAEQSYVYDEFFQNEDNFYHGVFTTITGTGTTTMLAEANSPDLTIQGFSQTGFTSFSFADANIKCGEAGPHTVEIWDSIPGGAKKLIKSYSVGTLAGRTLKSFSFSDSTMTIGDHYISIVTDAAGVVSEQDETNNVFETRLVVPPADLTVGTIKPSSASATIGSTVTFSATIRNSGSRTGPFQVSFSANGVQIGSTISVARVGEKDSITVLSAPYTVTTAERDCPVVIEVTADATNMVPESSKANNTSQLPFGSDLAPYMLSSEAGSAANPVVVRVGANTVFSPLVRNIGSRDIHGVTVRYTLSGVPIGTDSIGLIRAGEPFASPGSFSYTFTTAGNYTVKVEADTANSICEAKEGNNAGNFYIRVVETNPDLEVLSQYISPSSLNPNPGQAISIVGTVKNVGLKASQANVMRFMVDDIQLGADVPLNALQPGRDTTVAATAPYSSLITGVKVMKIVVDPGNTLVEEREDNNLATRSLIVGDAPDLARSHAGAISFNPNGFRKGDSVLISYAITNNGSQQGSAWVRFLILDAGNGLTAMDSVPFTLAAGASTVVSRKMLFGVNQGTVIAQIVNSSPMEFDLFNNDDTLSFSTVVKLKAPITVGGDLDMKAGAADLLPGWIGGKLVLGDYDLIVNGNVINFDTAHFVITDGGGRLRLINGNALNTFPVGTSLTSPNFVKINNTGTPDNFSVRVLPYVLTKGISGDSLRVANVKRTWLVEEQTPGGSNATLELFWSHAEQLPGFDSSLARLAHYSGSWLLGDIAPAIADSNGQFSKSQAGYTTFSPFTVTSGDGKALPLQLLKFTVTKQGGDAAINWETSEEVNVSRFIVQHSSSGQSFEDIGEEAATNRPGVNDYGFLHASVGPGLHYYRLKLVDLDGKATYSEIRFIRVDANRQVQVFPNPTEQFVTVAGLEPGTRVDLLSLDGKLLMQLPVTGPRMTIDLGRFAAGVYLIGIAQQDQIQYQKIIKK
ncbi:CARDB domain-containing protein [Flavitalea sp. BT771]|uniref:CARDB domain-containing protein n=1 Tax=Flavitalea sp. BT771 TaxID=3063329 RepID=UPI0026E1D3ED|nr:CARDB domain-containing protein [Flavitalea sp. BT771]MDO6429036.1 CARDB domain-containing protein [Flavitalea sp. BT771]MDV6218836.1 CARDB domain-containing protein [Flavitalea sp. BT771]